jgi:UDPglucose--hexose-1-phosphate uridylyltransferase
VISPQTARCPVDNSAWIGLDLGLDPVIISDSLMGETIIPTPSLPFDPVNHPHRRSDPLSGRHVLVSPHRALRPWLGQQDAPDKTELPHYDPECYLCPRNSRVGGIVNPDYSGAHVFDNDFPALLADSPTPPHSQDPLFQIEAAHGVSRVICFSPDHNATLPRLSPSAMRAVVDSWCAQSAELGRDYVWVQLFENKGAMMGCSNPHPHGQVWAVNYLPDEVEREDIRQRAYFAEHRRPMLLDVASREIELRERIVVSNDHWVAIVPFWASWPFETLLLPRFEVARMPALDDRQRTALAHIIQKLTRTYDNLFNVSFPYSMGWHGAPFDGRDPEGWQLHAHFYPPLLRSASIRKFMVGYEMMTEAQRDLTPEQAAERLRSVICD